MNRISLLTFVMFMIGFASCKQKEVTNSLQGEYVRTDDSNRLAYWLPEKDSVNHGYCQVAERLWMLGRENDSIDLFDYQAVQLREIRFHGQCHLQIL